MAMPMCMEHLLRGDAAAVDCPLLLQLLMLMQGRRIAVAQRLIQHSIYYDSIDQIIISSRNNCANCDSSVL